MILIQSCGINKYDDGPLLSFYSDKNRITNEWNIRKITIDGGDSTSLYKCSSCPFFLKFTNSNTLYANYIVNGQQQTVSSGNWNFEDNNKKVNLLTSENVLTGPFLNNGSWYITRSTKKQLWISHEKDGKSYEIQLE
jgi:hypothetical protein